MGIVQQKSDAFKKAKEQYKIFDASMWWAPRNKTIFRDVTDWEAQVRHMEERGIDAALVTPEFSRRYDSYIANEEVLPLLKGHDNIYGAIVVTPDMFMVPGKGEEYLKRMKDNRVIAAKMFPAAKYHSTKEYCIGRMCDALEKAGMPLIVWHIDTGFDAIDEICTNHPGLNVMLDSLDRKLLYHSRDYMSLLLKHKNFYLETHNLVLFDEYDVIDEVCGSGQLVYGSYSPYAEENFSIYPIYESQLTEEKKQGILAGNAEKLFGIKL